MMAWFTPMKCVRTILLLTLISYILVNLIFLSPSQVKVDLSVKNKDQTTTTIESVPVENLPSIEKPNEKLFEGKNPAGEAANSDAQHQANFNESLSFIINDINLKQEIRNENTFKPNENGSYCNVVVVQVHNRDNYLQFLIESLKKVRGVNSTLLIISHDFYSESIFKIIRSINFMPVMQIFYPKAMQLYRNEYPGEDPKDCPRNLKKDRAIAAKCNNAEYPDTYGHYREATYSQTKLHWTWKLHHVFENLAIMQNYQGRVVLMEEDHYFTPDAIHMLNLMSDALPAMCPHCRILTLGNYDKKPSYAFHNEVVLAPEFISSKHNMAMSFNRTVYNTIKNFTKDFCDYDDYNWDWSLQQIGHFNIPGKLPTLIVKTPRVYHIGECGVHHKGKKCDPALKAEPINNMVNMNAAKLFPASIVPGRSTVSTYITIKKMKPNGGWGDIRDHKLCASLLLG